MELLTPLKGFKFAAALVLGFKKIWRYLEDKTNFIQFYMANFIQAQK